jgi:hypothetical protein
MPVDARQKERTTSQSTVERIDRIVLMRQALVLRISGVLLLVAALGSCSVRGDPGKPPPPVIVPPANAADMAGKSPLLDNGAAAACSNGGGTYLGDLQCQTADGSIVRMRLVNAATRDSATPAHPGSPHAWALATTAIMFEYNKTSSTLLGGAVTIPENVQGGKELLSEWWRVSSRDQLLEMLEWLQFEGHRAAFEQLGRQVDAMSEKEFKAAEAALLEDPEQLYRAQIVRQYHHTLGQPGILAWDLIRYIALCRWGYLAGYLSQTEAWDHIMPAALRLQEAFGSWEDLQKDYLIGREFWSRQQTQRSGARFQEIFEHSIHDPSSPWNVNPWTMNLGVEAALLVTAK